MKAGGPAELSECEDDMMSWQDVAVMLFVAIAAGVLCWRALRLFTSRRRSGCTDCAGCARVGESSAPGSLIQLGTGRTSEEAEIWRS